MVSSLTGGFQLGADGIYRCSGFQQFVWQTHGFGTRAADPTADITLRQIHSDLVLNAAGLVGQAVLPASGDALITNTLRLTIGVRTADCVPILLLDSKQRAVAAVHAGWRGTALEIVHSTLRKMHSDFGTEPADVYAAIGPCIRECCYQVGEEVAQRFNATFPEWPPITGKRNLDLAEANRRQMLSCGVPASAIFDIKTCTSCQIESFYSFRREPQNPGRLLSTIARLA
jgi:YfiH family protein